MEMQGIRVELGDRSYDIVVDINILQDIGSVLRKFEYSNKIALISNPTVYKLYGDAVSRSLASAGFELKEIIIPDGEAYKNLQFVQQIYEDLLGNKLDRKSSLIALGGGVVGDITGFAASTYMRGIDFVQIPTTLLAQVDSSVGGKTGVNHPLGKNMIGTFWQPRLVWIDLQTLRTLPEREFLSGIAEVIKYGVIWDSELFSFLEHNRDLVLKLDQDALAYIISRSCTIKSDIVSRDERESGIRAILNFGHTVGHAIETATGYKEYLHGEAIAIGMYMEALLSCELGYFEKKDAVRIKDLIEYYGLPVKMRHGIGYSSIFEAMQLDKKAVSGSLKFVLPEKIGSVKIESGIKESDLRKIIEANIS